MEDKQIIDLYWNRSEEAISETDTKYGPYCYKIAYNILTNKEDSEESVYDTYMDAWNAMPPHRPTLLASFLGKITRRISIDRWRGRTATKRGGREIDLALDELEWCVSDSRSLEDELDRKELIRAVNQFLSSLPVTERRVFLHRYWAMESIENIAVTYNFSQSKVASMLHRTRKKLRIILEKEGFR